MPIVKIDRRTREGKAKAELIAKNLRTTRCMAVERHEEELLEMAFSVVGERSPIIEVPPYTNPDEREFNPDLHGRNKWVPWWAMSYKAKNALVQLNS